MSVSLFVIVIVLCVMYGFPFLWFHRFFRLLFLLPLSFTYMFASGVGSSFFYFIILSRFSFNSNLLSEIDHEYLILLLLV